MSGKPELLGFTARLSGEAPLRGPFFFLAPIVLRGPPGASALAGGSASARVTALQHPIQEIVTNEPFSNGTLDFSQNLVSICF